MCSCVADLKAFERRLTEYVSCLGPQTGRWRSEFSYQYRHLERLIIDLSGFVLISGQQFSAEKFSEENEHYYGTVA